MDVGGASNLDPARMEVKESICGREPEPAKMVSKYNALLFKVIPTLFYLTPFLKLKVYLAFFMESISFQYFTSSNLVFFIDFTVWIRKKIIPKILVLELIF